MTGPLQMPAFRGDYIDAYPPSCDATCPEHGPVRVLIALTDPYNFRLTPAPKEANR